MKRLLLVDNKMQSHPVAGLAKSTFSFLRPLLMMAVFFTASRAGAQSPEQNEAYKNAITSRSAKIVNTLSITDSVKYNNVLSIVADQYFALNNIQEEDTRAVNGIKSQSLDKDRQAEALKAAGEKKSATVEQLHKAFIGRLKDNLDGEQVEKVKDGMTYRVFPITYTAYLDMIPTLTTEQKEKIYTWLKEARELAMDAESADKKHAVFGKYKGRINNYLSAAGYDMKAEGEAWQKRIKDKKETKKRTG